MASQLPQGAEAAAAVSLTYTVVSLCCSCLVIWLTWCHNERISYIACIGYFTFISTVASLIQQIRLVALYRDVTFTQFAEKIANPDSPDHNISNGSVGIDLVLYYIQFASYNIQSMFIMFWASELAQSVYGMNKKFKWRRVLRHFNYAGRVIAVVLPLITVLVLQAPPPQKSPPLFMLLADVPLVLSLGCGSILMMAILGRYIHSRRKLLSFDARPANQAYWSGSQGSTILTRSSTTRRRRRSIYDSWLMTRFTIAFVLLAIFQLTGTLFQHFATNNTAKDLKAHAPDMSAGRAQTTFYLFMPGNTPGIALFIVFGTTAAFQRHMYKTFVPARFQKQAKPPLYHEPTDGDTSFAVSSPLSPAPSTAQDWSPLKSSSSVASSPSTVRDWSPLKTPASSAFSPSAARDWPSPLRTPSSSAFSPSAARDWLPPLKTPSSSARDWLPPLKTPSSSAFSPSAARGWSPIMAPSPTKAPPDLMKSLPTPPRPRAPPRWRRASMGPGDDTKSREGSAVFIMTRIVTDVADAPRTHGRSESSPAVVLMKPQKCPPPEWI